MKTIKLKKIKEIIFNILTYSFVAISLVMLILCIFSKKDNDGAVSLFGYQMRIVISESMEKNELTYNDIKKYRIKNIPVKSLVLIKTVPDNINKKLKFYSNLNIGDVITFRYLIGTKQETITHRIIDIGNNEFGKYIDLQGDNIVLSDNTSTSIQHININDENSPSYVIGKVIGKSYILGVILFAIKKPLGMFLLVIIPAFIIMVVELIKIINYFYLRKKEKAEKQILEQKQELEQLKQKLESLEKVNGGKNYV